MVDLTWESFVSAYHEAIFRFCFHFLRNREEAEDATQEAFLKAFKKFSSLKDIGAAKPWIYSIARNVCIDRKRWWRSYLTFAEAKRSEIAIDSSQPDLKLTLSTLVAKLPLKQREVFILRHWHDFSTEETAKMLGLEEGTVKSHLKRAVDKLKEELINSGDMR